MADRQLSRFLEFAGLQMAAEAFLLRDVDGGVLPGINEVQNRLLLGNTHASKFMPTSAAEFTAKYEVLAQHRNDPLLAGGAGFSGTLFRNLTTGELTLSFRSTEFIDDAVRDSKATNEFEVKEIGWALGQISEMESWYRQLRQDPGLLGGKQFNVTGYSLGGHLATAFNLLRQEEAAAGGPANPILATYTFNGAGVGGLQPGKRLTDVLRVFESVLADPGHVAWTSLGIATRASIGVTAADRAAKIAQEWLRLQVLPADFAFDTRPPVGMQSSLQYQIAALVAARDTVPVSNFPFFGGVNWIPSSPVFAPASQRIPSLIEVVGSDSGRLGPSFVANSGLHYGTRHEVYIEDQPLSRGTYNLLVDQGSVVSFPASNDFADTHSLVLLVDALSLLAAFEALDPAFTVDDGADILAAMSSSRASTLFFTQGGAEGDTLERTLDALRALVSGPGQPPTMPDYTLTLSGNTWHDVGLRAPFHDNLAALKAQIAALGDAAAGVRRILPVAHADPAAVAALAAGSAPDAVAYRYALAELNPFVLTGFDYSLHNASGELDLFDGMSGTGTLSGEWLAARAEMLSAQLRYNVFNGGTLAAISTRYEDRRLEVNLGPNLPGTEMVLFGEGGADSLSGSFGNDRIFSGSGADAISGGGGRDYLEGGSGDDRLEGGSGDDRLYGGAGFDTYVYGSGDGFDRIEDADGVGAVSYLGRTLSGGQQVAPGVYEDAAGTRYALIEEPGGERMLLVGNAFSIAGFESGDLGISLIDGEFTPDVPSGSFTRFYVDTIAPADGPANPDPRTGHALNLGGSDANDLVDLSVGRSFSVYTRAGDDSILLAAGAQDLFATLDAGAGDDFIDASLAGLLADRRIAGGSGADYIVGSVYGDSIHGDNYRAMTGPGGTSFEVDGFRFNSAMLADFGSGFGGYLPLLELFALYGADLSFEQAIANLQAEGWGFSGGVPQALAYALGDPGQSFDDYIDGGEGDDSVDGGSGSDFILGGAGNDLLGGDYDLTGLDAITYANLAAQFGDLASRFGQAGDDHIDGAAGDDSILDLNGGNDILVGGEGDDRIESAEGLGLDPAGALNFVDAGPGSDRISVINMTGGMDIVDAGDGDDFISVQSSLSSHVRGGAGSDQIEVAGVDMLIDGGDGDDRYVLHQMPFGDTPGLGVQHARIRDASGVDSIDGAFWSLVRQEDIFAEFELALGWEGTLPEYLYSERVVRRGNDLVKSAYLSLDGTSSYGEQELNFEGWFDGPDFRLENIEYRFAPFGPPASLSAAEFEAWGSRHYGGFGDQSILGTESFDRVIAASGNDVLVLGGGDDLVFGAAGDDFLDGGAGDDSYYYRRGDGHDMVADEVGVDVLRLAPGITPHDISLSYEGASLVLRIADGSLTLEGSVPGDSGGDLPIDMIRYADGSSVQLAVLAASLQPPPSDIEPVIQPPAAEPSEITAASSSSEGIGAAAPEASYAPAVAPVPSQAVEVFDPAPAEEPDRSRPATAFSLAESETPYREETPIVGRSSDPIYREIDARLDVLLQAGRANLGERYAEAIEEFERRRTGDEEPAADPQIPSGGEMGRWNEAVHDWHARHPAFESLEGERQDGARGSHWSGFVGSGPTLDELVTLGSRPGLGNPYALPVLAGAGAAPGLSEGLIRLGA